MFHNCFILGLGKSGQASADLCKQLGIAHVIYDDHQSLTPPLDVRYDAVIKSPGIPYTHEIVQQAEAFSIPIMTEIEFASRLFDNPIIAITGTNGKTTTTSWVGEAFIQHNKPCFVGGNIGTPLSSKAFELQDETVILECSSFQLKGTSSFRPHIACLLNLSPTHLNYHGTFDDYRQSKLRLFNNQLASDFAIINADMSEFTSILPRIHATLVPFSSTQSLTSGVCLEQVEGEIWIVYRNLLQQSGRICKANRIALRGNHNLENALAVAAILLCYGFSEGQIAYTLQHFQGVEHRLERLATLPICYNDSKATNPESTIKALEAMEQPVILIAGGYNSGTDLSPLLPFLPAKVSTLIAYGQTRFLLQDLALSANIPCLCIHTTFEDAVSAAFSKAKPHDTILLSPACSSYDMFTSFEGRGRRFKECCEIYSKK